MRKPKAKTARILKLFLLSSFVFAGPAGVLFSQDCEGCRRTAVLQDVENLEFGTIQSLLVHALTTPCFHLQDLDTVIAYRERAKREGWSFLVKESQWNPPEYTLTARYETGLEETVKSRLVVTLLFHDGEPITE